MSREQLRARYVTVSADVELNNDDRWSTRLDEEYDTVEIDRKQECLEDDTIKAELVDAYISVSPVARRSCAYKQPYLLISRLNLQEY